MRRFLVLAGLFSALAADGSVQAQRTVDRLGYSTAPQVNIWFATGSQAWYGQGMQVEFRTDDDAYVVIGRVDSEGRLSILYPYSRSQRAWVRGNMTTTVRNPRLHSNASFYVSDRLRGYVFAIASYTPVDLSTFDTRDFQRIGGFSQFTQVNRAVARDPDEYVSRVAAELFWGTDAEYDYDVAYYSPNIGSMTYMASALSFCDMNAFRRLSLRYPWYTYDDYVMSPYDQVCRDYYLGLQCYSAFALIVPGFCRYTPYRETIIATLPQYPSPPDTARANEGIIRSGLWRPDTVSGAPEDRPNAEPDRAQRFTADIGRNGKGASSDFEGIYSIPPRAKEKLAADGGVEVIRGNKRSIERGRDVREARRADGSPSTVNKGGKEVRVADADPVRLAPPRREAPRSYEPIIGASKAPKRSSGVYAGGSPYSGSGTSSGASRPSGNSADKGMNAPRPASSGSGGSGGNIGSAANTSGKTKEKPPQ